MPTTKRDLQALHYLAKRLREETRGAGEWHDPGLWPVLAKLEGHNLAITIERVTRHAADPDARTPAAIERPFVPEAVAPGPRQPAKPGRDECPHHKGEHAGACRICPVDQISHPQDPEIDPAHSAAKALGRGPFRPKTEESQ